MKPLVNFSNVFLLVEQDIVLVQHKMLVIV
jgi:hypothetical protein